MNKSKIEKHIHFEDVEFIIKNKDITNAEITNLELEIAHFENLKDGYKSMDYSSEGGGKTNKISSPVENAVLDSDKKINQFKRILSEKKLIVQKLENAMTTLEDIEKTIIKYKYSNGMSWKVIATKTHLSRNICSSLNKKAINKLADIIFCARC